MILGYFSCLQGFHCTHSHDAPTYHSIHTCLCVFLTWVLSVGLKLSLLLRVLVIFLGISFRFSLGNGLDKSIVFVLLGKEKLLLTEFIIAIEIVTSSEIKMIQLEFELVKTHIPFNLDFAYGQSTDPTSVAPDDIAAGTSNG